MTVSTYSGRRYYDFNPSLSLHSFPIFSYSHSTELPILWTHYAHEQTYKNISSRLNDDAWCSIFIFLSGNFSFLINGHMYTPSYGDAVIIRAHEKYTSIFPEPSYVDYHQIYFPITFFEKTQENNLFMDLFYNKNKQTLISPNKALSSEILEHLRSLNRLSESNDSYCDIIMYSHIIQLSAAIRTAAISQPPSLSDSKMPQKLNDAILHIHNNFLTLEGVNEVARTCNVTNTYLSRVFKKHLSCTPNEYITNLRISYAKYLLSEGVSITDTCYKSGFNNYTYFISKFKQTTGFTPSEFKKHNT